MRKTSTSSSTQPVLTFQHSHSEIASGEDWTDFEYWLRISNDFYTPLLSRGPNIKVPCLPWPSLLVRKVYKSLCRLVSSMKSIGQHAFGNCDNLTKISLPEGLEFVGLEAFAGCINLKRVDIYGEYTHFGTATLASCYSLREIHCYDYNSLTIDRPEFFIDKEAVEKCALYVRPAFRDSYRYDSYFCQFRDNFYLE